jgi:hypothetical protein
MAHGPFAMRKWAHLSGTVVHDLSPDNQTRSNWNLETILCLFYDGVDGSTWHVSCLAALINTIWRGLATATASQNITALPDIEKFTILITRSVTCWPFHIDDVIY